MWLQKEILLKPRPRGFHLITSDLLQELHELCTLKVGMINLFILHTSASLTLNENADPSVRTDFEGYFTRTVRENESWHLHQDEGPDDLPAHLKASILGCSLDIPITNGRLRLGTWQGIYLCEHRNTGGSRRIVATIHGEQV